jgi:hypothetical protein
LAADAELRATDDAVRASAIDRRWKRAWLQFLYGWRRLFDELGQGRRDISAADARAVIGARNEGRSWRADFLRLKRAGFPRELEDMGAWEAGVRDAEELGALVYPPGVIKAELDTVNAGVTQLDSDIMASNVRDAFKKSWRLFVAEWQAFYKNNSGFWSRMWGAVYEKATEYRKRVEQWREAFEREGGRSTSPGLTVPETPGTGKWKWVLLGAGGLLVAGAVVGKAVTR